MSVELGSKVSCPDCGAGFYDLGKVELTCPKCDHAFIVDDSVASDGGEHIIPHNDDSAPILLKDDEPHAMQHIDGAGDIDLSEFDDVASSKISEGGVSDIEDVNELDDHIESFSELEDMEVEEDRINTDDADDDIVIEEMESLETLVDKVEEIDSVA